MCCGNRVIIIIQSCTKIIILIVIPNEGGVVVEVGKVANMDEVTETATR